MVFICIFLCIGPLVNVVPYPAVVTKDFPTQEFLIHLSISLETEVFFYIVQHDKRFWILAQVRVVLLFCIQNDMIYNLHSESQG